MTFVTGLFDAGLAFLALFLVFRPLEFAHPAREGQRVLRPQFWTDVGFLVGQYVLFNALVLRALAYAQPWIRAAMPVGVRSCVGALPVWVQAILVILGGDLLIYWGHRLQHRVGFLWRFHSIHHSAEHLDWLAAHREHPVDAIYTQLLVNLPIFALGFPLRTLALFAAFRGLWAVYIHANVRLPIGPLRVLIGAPELHHLYHHRARDSGNYANVSPLMDVLFGTYRCPDHEPPALGTDEPVPAGYLGQLAYPFGLAKRRGSAGGRPTRPKIRAWTGPSHIVGRPHKS